MREPPKKRPAPAQPRVRAKGLSQASKALLYDCLMTVAKRMRQRRSVGPSFQEVHAAALDEFRRLQGTAKTGTTNPATGEEVVTLILLAYDGGHEEKPGDVLRRSHELRGAVMSWDQATRDAAANHCAALHVQASDHDDVVVPRIPPALRDLVLKVYQRDITGA